jgi:hypothetical protein
MRSLLHACCTTDNLNQTVKQRHLSAPMRHRIGRGRSIRVLYDTRTQAFVSRVLAAAPSKGRAEDEGAFGLIDAAPLQHTACRISSGKRKLKSYEQRGLG